MTVNPADATISVEVICMKRIISLLLVLSMLAGFAAFAAQAVPSTEPQTDIDSFSQSISRTVNDYGLTAQGTPDSLQEFETCRLILRSERKVDYMGASKVIEAFDGMVLLQYETAAQTKAAYDYYSSLDCVDFLECDKVVSVAAQTGGEYPYEPIAEYFSWGSEYTGFGELNDYIVENEVALAPVYVAVIDTGVNFNHIRLAGRIEETGYNISETGDPDSALDDNGHGTHVAGTIVNNTFSNVIIRPYKCFGSDGESSNFLIATAIRKAVDDGNGIINMSFENLEESDYVNIALEYAKEETDPVMVAAMGNSGTDAEEYMPIPATSPLVIAVSAMSKTGGKLAGSNFSKKYVELTAPGDRIRGPYKFNQNFALLSGTSMAAPFVSAVAAAAKSIYPSASTQQIRSLMNETAIPLFTDPQNLGYFGNGMVYAMGVLEGFDGIEPYFECTQEPVFATESGLYTDSVTVTIECEEGATVYYTTDGTVPTEDSILYEGEITLTKGTDFLAAAYSDGKAKSPVATASYRILETASASFLTVDDNGIITAISGEHTDIRVPETMQSVSGKTVTVSAVAQDVFSGYGYLRHIELPVTVTSIGSNAFYNCANLEHIEMTGAETVGDYAFYGCSKLGAFSIPNAGEIGSYAFYNCGSEGGETAAFFLDNLRSLGEFAFYSSFVSHFYAPAAADDIGESAFENCANLIEIYFPCATAVGANAFSGCPKLTSVAFDEAVTVGDGAFFSCESIRSLSLEKAESLGNAALHGCTSLQALSVPSLKTVYLDSFKDVTADITELYLPQLETIHDVEGAAMPLSITEFYAPKLKNIPANTFKGNTALSKVTLGSAESIGDYAFYECKAITEIDLSTVKTIGSYAFAYCSAISGVNLTALQYLGDYSFAYCSKLKDFYMPELLECGGFAFYGAPYTRIFAPKLIKANRRMFAVTTNSGMATVIDLSSLKTVTYYNFFEKSPRYLVLSSLETGDFYTAAAKVYLPDTYTGTAYGTRVEGPTLMAHSESDAVYSYLPSQADSAATLRVSAYGPNLTYQWYTSADGNRSTSSCVAISGATAPELTLLTAPDAPYYYCVVTSVFNGKTVSAYSDSVKNASYLGGAQRADYSALIAAKERIPADLSPYTSASVTRLENALAAVNYNLPASSQTAADNCANNILAAIGALEYIGGDYTAVDAELLKVPQNLDFYTDETAAAVEYAVQSIIRGLDCRSDARTECMAVLIADKLGRLCLKKADYSALEDALSTVPQDLRLYTDESVEVLQAVLDSIDYNLYLPDQKKVDEYTSALRKAVGELVPNAENYAQLLELIDSLPEDMSVYTEESCAELEAVLDGIENELDARNAAQVEEYILALSQAIDALEYKKADYTALDEELSAVPKDLSIYTDESAAKLQKVLDGIDRNLAANQQETVDGYVQAVRDAVAALVLKDADYTAVEKAIASIPDDLRFYTDESVSALEQSKDAIIYGLDITQQATVDGYANAVSSAVEKLEYDKEKTRPMIRLNTDKKFVLEAPSDSFDVYYTLDGTDPTAENGTRYTSPLDLSRRAVSVIKAAAFAGGEKVSADASYRMTTFAEITVKCGKTVKALSDSYSGKIRWSSRNLAVATVDSNGYITGESKGETTVTATFDTGRRIIFNVTVEYTFYQWLADFFRSLFDWLRL